MSPSRDGSRNPLIRAVCDRIAIAGGRLRDQRSVLVPCELEREVCPRLAGRSVGTVRELLVRCASRFHPRGNEQTLSTVSISRRHSTILHDAPTRGSSVVLTQRNIIAGRHFAEVDCPGPVLVDLMHETSRVDAGCVRSVSTGIVAGRFAPSPEASHRRFVREPAS